MARFGTETRVLCIFRNLEFNRKDCAFKVATYVMRKPLADILEKQTQKKIYYKNYDKN